MKQLFCISMVVVTGSMVAMEKPYTAQEKAYVLAHQMPADHAWHDDEKRRSEGGDFRADGGARHIVAKRIAIETVIRNQNFKHIQLTPAHIYCVTMPEGKTIQVQSTDEITNPFHMTYYVLQKKQRHMPHIQLNANQAEELFKLFKCIFNCFQDEVKVTEEGVYLMPEVGGNHFVTSWRELSSNNFSYDDGAKEVVEKKRVELKEYVFKCLKLGKAKYHHTTLNEAIVGQNPLRLLPELDAVSVEFEEAKDLALRKYKYLNAMTERAPLWGHIFTSAEQRSAFWSAVNSSDNDIVL